MRMNKDQISKIGKDLNVQLRVSLEYYLTPLNKLCSQSFPELSVDVLEYLLKDCRYHKYLNCSDCSGATPIMNICEYNSSKTDVAKVLIEWGADVHIKNEYVTSLLDILHTSDNLSMIKYLIEEKNIKYSDIEVINALCVSDQHLRIIKYLLSMYNIDLDNIYDTHGFTLLMASCVNNNLDVVRYLVNECKVDVDQSDMWNEQSPLISACYTSLECVKILVESGADIHRRCKTAYSCGSAVKTATRHITILEYLLSFPIPLETKEIYKNDKLLSHVCANVSYPNAEDAISVIRLLIKTFGIEQIHERNKRGETPLIRACSRFSPIIEIVKILVELGSNVNDHTIRGLTPLMYLSCRRVRPIVEYVVENSNVDVNARDEKGEMAIHKTKDPQLREYLLSRSSPFWRVPSMVRGG